MSKLSVGLMVVFSLTLGLSYAEDGAFLSNLNELSVTAQSDMRQRRARQLEQSNSDRLLEEYKSPCAGQAAPVLADCFPETMKPVQTLADVPAAHHVSVVVSKTELSVDGNPVIQLERDDETGQPEVPEVELEGQLISALFGKLDIERQIQQQIGQTLSIPGVEFSGEYMLSVDEEVSFEVIRQVMYTAGQAQYGTVHFVGFNRWQDELVSFESSLPAIGAPGMYEEMDEEFSLNLSVVVRESGLDVVSNDSDLLSVPSNEGPDFPCAFDRPCQGIDDYDWEGFNALMARMKAKYPEEETIIVVPEGGISWDILARTMDYARCEPFLDMGASKAEWSQWSSQRTDVFTSPVIAGGAQ